jgi:fused signal recognition particle receptor
MFKSLKEKFSGWLGKKKEDEIIVEEAKKELKKREEKKKEERKPKRRVLKIGKKKEEEGSFQASDEAEKIIEEVEGKDELFEGEKKVEKIVSEEAKELVDEGIYGKGAEEDSKEESGFFSRLRNRIVLSKLSEEDFDEMFEEFEMSLLENNVALEVVDKIKEGLAKELVGEDVKKGKAQEKIIEALKKSVEDVLLEPDDWIEKIKEKKEPYVILFFGINGSGKTTSLAKLAHKLEKEGLSCVLGAGDTFRAASIEQLEKHAEKLKIPLIKHEYKSDPAAVGFDAVQYAKKNRKKVVLIDTAGRMYTKKDLMREMEKIVRVTKPDLKIFVGESITGNDGVEQAKKFHEAVGIDGIILTKADVDDKAGTILSVSYVTGKPIYFLGMGQMYKDLKEFKKKDILGYLGLN